MSKLNDLITKLCPGGVQYKKLDEVSEIKRGRRVVKKELSQDSNSGYPVYQNSLKPLGYHTCSNEKAGTPFVIAAGSAGEIGYSDVDYWGADDCYSIECDDNTVNGRYIYHVLLLKQGRIKSQVRRASIPRLSSTAIKHLEIPVPPIEIQHEVVRILDSFTELEAELEAELAGRIEQYEYYRDHLLDKKNLEAMDGKPVETMKLGEVCNYVKNKVDIADILPENYTSVENLIKNCGGRMNAISVPKDGKCTDVMINDILLGNIRPNLRKAWLATCAGGASNDVLVIRIKDGVNLNARYLYQIIAGNDFSCYNIRHMRGAKMPRGDKSKILDYELPVPSLATQEHVVDILDRFDTLTTSLTEGIPAEIAMRREQYEYYRSRLLDFPRLPEDSDSDNE